MSVRARGGGGFPAFEPVKSRQTLIFDKTVETLDLSTGSYFEINLNSNIETLSLIRWAPAPVVNRVTLEIVNPGFYQVNLSFAKWPGATVPIITPNGTDLIELTSHRGGNPGTIIGKIWQNIR